LNVTVLFRGRFLGVFAPVDDGFPAMLAELFQFLHDFFVALLVISRDVVARLALGAIPGAELTFTPCHKRNIKYYSPSLTGIAITKSNPWARQSHDSQNGRQVK